MIIFGIRSRIIQPADNKTYDCGNCHSRGTVSFSFIARYFHIFWIPIFPLSKKGISQCSHCKQVLYEKEMTPEMRQDCLSASATAKRPITHYFGLMLIALLFCLMVFSIMTNTAKKTEYIKSPKINDIYKVEKSAGYTVYKVINVKGDTIFFKPHSAMIKSYMKISKLENTDDYSDDTLKFTKNQIQEMQGSVKSEFGKLYGIERK